MTNSSLKDYLKTEARLVGIVPDDIDDRIEMAIELGTDEFWGSWNWFFKYKEATFTVTTTASNYELPNDFGGLVQMVEQESSFGGELSYVHKNEFDRQVPRPATESSGTPLIYTTYMDAGKYKVGFYPRPNTTMSFNLVYVMRRTLDVASIPDAFAPGVMAACARYIPRMDSENGLILERRYDLILKRLKVMNKTNHKPIDTLGVQTTTQRRLPVWADRNASIV